MSSPSSSLSVKAGPSDREGEGSGCARGTKADRGKAQGGGEKETFVLIDGERLIGAY